MSNIIYEYKNIFSPPHGSEMNEHTISTFLISKKVYDFFAHIFSAIYEALFYVFIFCGIVREQLGHAYCYFKHGDHKIA